MKRNPHSVFDPQGRRKYLTLKEGKAFLKLANQLPPERALFCLTIYYTGIRISEALSLTPENIDVAAGVVLVRTLKKRKYQEYRRIPIPWWLVKALLKLRTKTPQSRFWEFSRVTGWRIIKRVMAGAKIAGIQATTKGLRHGFGVRSILTKVPLTTVQYLIGHADLATTAIYLQARDGELRKIMGQSWK